eukprot:TRINITY_DN141_c0_g1_i1.p1 TRINITY_DN141_c0_g1~~TRINITY_DN141_c0_g1_i1.p1  ORF type:complete len:353 (-),score=43.15 TRINITY_DN141_c0_g1_i1:45-1103(-)
MIRRPPRSTPIKSSAASDVYKRQVMNNAIVVRTTPLGFTDESPLGFTRESTSSGDIVRYGTDLFAGPSDFQEIFGIATEAPQLYLRILFKDHITPLKWARDIQKMSKSVIGPKEYQLLREFSKEYSGSLMEPYEGFLGLPMADQSQYVDKHVGLAVEKAEFCLKTQLTSISYVDVVYVLATLAFCLETSSMLTSAASRHEDIKSEVKKIEKQYMEPALAAIIEAIKNGSVPDLQHPFRTLKFAIERLEDQARILEERQLTLRSRGFTNGIFTAIGFALTVATAIILPGVGVLGGEWKATNVVAATTIGATAANGFMLTKCYDLSNQLQVTIDSIRKRLQDLQTELVNHQTSL